MVSLETPEPGVFIVVQADASNSNLRWLHVPATKLDIKTQHLMDCWVLFLTSTLRPNKISGLVS
jgi:hypothetical protein